MAKINDIINESWGPYSHTEVEAALKEEIRSLRESAGTPGKDGKDGANGRDGADGKSAYEIAVENGFTGDEEAWLASLHGADGANGRDGADGANGRDGADGKSAYEIAVENGFTGDEEAWLASLHGADGQDGRDGRDGADGADGKDGADGANGRDGADGKSAYEIAVENGFTGDEEAWLASLLTSDKVSVTTNQNGTFTLHVDETEYTINLNHTHEGMAKVVVDTDANLPDPSEMDEDTVYGVLDNGALVALYVGGYPFYAGSGGGTPLPPALTSPTEDLDLGTIQNGSASGTVLVKGKRLTAPLTLSFSANSGFAFDTSGTLPTGVSVDNSGVMTITAAAAIAGVTIPIQYTGGDFMPSATLSIVSVTDEIDESITVSASGFTEVDDVETWALRWGGNIELVKNKAMVVDERSEATDNDIRIIDMPGYCLIKFQPYQAASQQHKIHYGYNPVEVANSLTYEDPDDHQTRRCRMAAHSYASFDANFNTEYDSVTGEIVGHLFDSGRFEMDRGSQSTLGTNTNQYRPFSTNNTSKGHVVATYIVATLSMENLTDCYIYHTTGGSYIWNPFNNNQALDT